MVPFRPKQNFGIIYYSTRSKNKVLVVTYLLLIFYQNTSTSTTKFGGRERETERSREFQSCLDLGFRRVGKDLTRGHQK